jgi:hypothetical protein
MVGVYGLREIVEARRQDEWSDELAVVAAVATELRDHHPECHGRRAC